MLSANFKPKRTAAASRGFLATARLSCITARCTQTVPRQRQSSPRGTPPKFGISDGTGWGVAVLNRKPAISLKRGKIGLRLLLMTNRKSHMRFRLVPKSMTLDDLERPLWTLFQNTCVFEPITKIWMKIDPHFQQRRCSSVTLDSDSVRFMRIFAAVSTDTKHVTLNDLEWLFYVKFYFAPICL